jgi:hypothetical protein
MDVIGAPWAAGLVLVTLTVSTPGAAAAAAAPDSTALAGLRAAASGYHRFRIVTGKGEFLVNSLHVDAEGVVVQAPQARPAVILGGEASRDASRRASWAEVERIEGLRSRGFRGALVGGLVGSIAGLAAKQAFEGSLHDASGIAILAIPIGAVVGALAGAAIGSSTGWKPLYP